MVMYFRYMFFNSLFLCFLGSLYFSKVSCQNTQCTSTIQTPQCLKYGFNVTSFPNHIGHVNKADAETELTKIFNFVQTTGCRHSTTVAEPLGCAIMFPLCQNGKNVVPCKDYCTDIIQTCQINTIPGYTEAANLCSMFPVTGQCLDFRPKQNQVPKG